MKTASEYLSEAAPELLQAVEAGKAYFEALKKHAARPGIIAEGSKYISGQDLDDLFEIWMDATDAALAKAKGSPFFRQVPADDDPRVLRRAAEFLAAYYANTQANPDIAGELREAIELARLELESEVGK